MNLSNGNKTTRDYKCQNKNGLETSINFTPIKLIVGILQPGPLSSPD
jgi:hypothetical protein